MTGKGQTMNPDGKEQNLARIRRLIEDIPVAMLTTLQPRDGSLHSRPMIVQPGEFHGEFVFFSKFGSAKVDEIRSGSQVNLAFGDPSAGRYLSVSGVATIDRSPEHLREKWSEVFRGWFPRGLEEPDLALLRVEARSADIWDARAHINGEYLELS